MHAVSATRAGLRARAAPDRVAEALVDLLGDAPRRLAMGRRARERAEAEFSYDVLAARLRDGIDGACLRS